MLSQTKTTFGSLVMTDLRHIPKKLPGCRATGSGKNCNLFHFWAPSYRRDLPLSNGGSPRAVLHWEPPQKTLKKNSLRKKTLRFVSCQRERERESERKRERERALVRVCILSLASDAIVESSPLLKKYSNHSTKETNFNFEKDIHK